MSFDLRSDLVNEARRYAENVAGSSGLAVEDDEILDDEPTTATTVTLEPFGEVTLPGGTVYRPRDLYGMEDLAWLNQTRADREHVLLYGPPGTGKTVAAMAAFAHLAQHTDVSDPTSPMEHYGVETIVCSADTREADFLGTFVQDPNSGEYIWQPGPLHRALIHGIPLYVDEIFLAESRVLSSVLYPVMDGRTHLVIAANPALAPVPVPEGFFVIASGNPDVHGAVFSEALRDRFDHHVEIGTDWELARELEVPEQMVTIAQNLDGRRLAADISWSPQLRTLLSFRDAVRKYGLKYALDNLVSKAPAEDRPVVLEAIESSGYAGNDAGVLTMGGRPKSTGAK